ISVSIMMDKSLTLWLTTIMTVMLLATSSLPLTSATYSIKESDAGKPIITGIHKGYGDSGLPDVDSLNYDLALVRFVTNYTLTANTTLVLSYVYDACYNCMYQPLISMTNQSTSYIQLATPFGYRINATVYDRDNHVISLSQPLSYEFGERGVYDINILLIVNQASKFMTSSVEVQLQPVNPFIPIAVAFAIFFFLALVWVFALYRYRAYKAESLEYQLQQIEVSVEPKKDRLRSLDAFRGFSITIMIFVNYGGGGYWFFNHSYWNGLTVADLVFPWFVFIMGVAMPLSFKALEARGTPKSTVIIKLVRRSITLFLLGMFLNNGYDLGHWRILGVLQRFGVSYLVVGLIILLVPVWHTSYDGSHEESQLFISSSIQDNHKARKSTAGLIADIIPYWIQWVVALLVLTLWFLLTFLVDVPGCGRGYLGPGGISDGGRYQNCTGGAAGYIDRKIFTLNHIYQTPTCQPIYDTGAYDPEGTLGHLTSIFMCWLGVQCGRTFLTFRTNSERIVRWSVWGLVLCAIAAGLCGMSQNGGWLPINKNLWTPSFVILLSGFAFWVLSIMYLLVDVFKVWNGAPFVYVGMNPITIYMGHEILGGYFPFSFYTNPTTHTLFMLSNCIGVGCWLVIAYMMYRNKVFINI
ncbi:hypothetical protein SAMD00019534_008850, partial [Acytostelium subglobosum LB1]|uniref:hypothetical protein n=1 Tax=Acytostelium subglobosum LB1 TaxID=1410327 RepID=UPI0006449C45